MKRLKDTDYKILFELMKNSKITDRKLARKIGVSQPTVTRRRTMLEKETLLKYTAIPNLEKLGIGIIAFTFVSWKPETRKPLRQKRQSQKFDKLHEKLFSKHPNLIFAAAGRGWGTSGGVFVSLHKDYACYANFMKELEIEWGEYMQKLDSFMVSVKGGEIRRPLTFKHLVDYIKKNEK
jgi:DNA-binding Lrp family transcriptional regulator